MNATMANVCLFISVLPWPCDENYEMILPVNRKEQMLSLLDEFKSSHFYPYFEIKSKSANKEISC